MRFNPVGLVHLRMRGPSAEAVIAHAQRARTLTCTVLDDVGLSARLQQFGVPYSIARLYAFEPHPNTDDAGAIRAYARARYDDLRRLRDAAGSPNVLFQVNNEQGFRRDDFIMYTRLIEFAMQDPDGPVGMVFWNGATGVVPNGYWNGHGTQYVQIDNGWSASWALDFVHQMHAARSARLPSGAYAFLMGAHMYSTYYPLIAVNAGAHRKQMRDRWDAQYADAWGAHHAFLRGEKWVDWRLPQDHIGRDVQAIRHALRWTVSADGRRMQPGASTPHTDGAFVDCPRTVVTECGADAMNDVVGVHLDQFRASALSAQSEEDETQRWRGGRKRPSVGQRPTPSAKGAKGQSVDYARALGLSDEALIDDFDGEAEAQAAGPRGYKTLAATWAQASWFPGESAGDVLVYWHQWAWKVVLAQTGVVLGMHGFCEGDTGGWEGFNVHGDSDYYEAMEMMALDIPAHWLAEDGTMPINGYAEMVAQLMNMGTSKTLTIRDAPATTGKALGVIEPGDTIGYKKPIEGQDIGQGRGSLWVPVWSGRQQAEGYAHSYFLVLPDDTLEPPVVEEPPTPEEIREVLKGEVGVILLEAQASMKALVEQVIERIQGL